VTNTSCPGDELEPEDHRVLGQLTLAAKNHQRLVNPKRIANGYRRLSMDESTWKDSIQYLIHIGYAEKTDGILYLDIRCECEMEKDLPKLGAKSRETLQNETLSGSSWRKVSLRRHETRSRDEVRGAPPGARRYPPIGGVAHLKTSIVSSKQLADAQLAPSAKPLRKVKRRVVSIVGEPSAKTVTTLPQLRSMFRQKFVAAEINQKLNITTPHILDKVEERVFLGALKQMRTDQGLSCDQILAMMDEFMAMVLSGEFKIEGKHVWRVFIANRAALLERSRRVERFGTGQGKSLSAEQRERRLDRIRRGG
jgi:hypothetical protein